MKFFIIFTLLLASSLSFADTLKRGTAITTVLNNDTGPIQIKIKENAAKLIYDSLKANAVMTMRTGAFDLFEKRAENIFCTKSSVDEDLPAYECTLKLGAYGNILRMN